MAQRNTAVKGLDLGTSRIVMAQPEGDDEFAFTSRLNAFVSLPYSKVTVRTFEREGIPFAAGDNEIIAYGDRAEEFANIVDGDTRRPMQTGLLNPDEPKSLQMIELILREMCGEAKRGERICFSVPAAPPDNSEGVIHHERTVAQMLERLGYDVMSLNEGLAVVYAELEDASYTGIGVSFGGGMCNVCVSYLGLPAISFSTVRAGDYIDHSAAAVSGETPSTVRIRKEREFSLNGFSKSSVDQALSVYYADVINTAADGLAKTLSETKKLPRLDKPLPLVIAGGTSLAGSFEKEFEKAIRARKFPVDIGDVRRSHDPLNTTAKGTLMAALLES